MEAKKSGFIKEYWPQLTSIVIILLTLGQMYSEFKTLKQELKDSIKNTEKMSQEFKEMVEKSVLILNEEDNGVRGDFEVADENLKEQIIESRTYEDMRERATTAEMKVWYYEQMKK